MTETSNPGPVGPSDAVQGRLTAYGRAVEHANIASELAVAAAGRGSVGAAAIASAHAQTALAWAKIAQLSGRNTQRRPASPDTHRGR